MWEYCKSRTYPVNDAMNIIILRQKPFNQVAVSGTKGGGCEAEHV